MATDARRARGKLRFASKDHYRRTACRVKLTRSNAAQCVDSAGVCCEMWRKVENPMNLYPGVSQRELIRLIGLFRCRFVRIGVGGARRNAGVDQHVAGPEERMLRLGHFVGGRRVSAAARRRGSAATRPSGARPAARRRRRRVRQLLGELAHQVETRLPAGSPAAQQHRPRAAGHQPADRQEHLVAGHGWRAAASWRLRRRCGSRAGRSRRARPKAAEPVAQRSCPACPGRAGPAPSRTGPARTARCRPARSAAGTACRRPTRPPAAAT